VVQPGFEHEAWLHRAVKAFIWYQVSTANETLASLKLTAES
jgi:hypothetical protein